MNSLKDISKSYNDYQLIQIGIELVYKLHSLAEHNPELLMNPYIDKAVGLADQWQQEFIRLYVEKGTN